MSSCLSDILDGVPDPLELAEPIPPGTAMAELLESSITELAVGSDGDDILQRVRQAQPVALTQPIKVRALVLRSVALKQPIRTKMN